MHSDKRMSEWWKENNLNDVIEDYIGSIDMLRPGHNYEPSAFIHHLDEKKTKCYLHFGVEEYVRDLYKDYNNIGHYALFEQTEKTILNFTAKTPSSIRQKKDKKPIKPNIHFNEALHAARKAAEDKKLKQAETAVENQRNADDEDASWARTTSKGPSASDAIVQFPADQRNILRDKILKQLASVVGIDRSQLELYVPEEILTLTDEEEKHWNNKKAEAAKYAIECTIENMRYDGISVDEEDDDGITHYFNCLMENFVFDMGMRAGYGKNSNKCICPCW